MTKAETDSRLEEVRKAVGEMPDGATLIDVAMRLSIPVAQRNLQRWLGMLVEQDRIVRIGGSHRSRYKLRDGADADVPPQVSALGQAILRLVNQPIGERTRSQYHRDWLDSYRPNQSYFVPEPVRARLRSPSAAPGGAGPALAWRDPAVLSRVLADLAWRSQWWEVQASDPAAKSLEPADVTAWLAQPESMNARPDVQLVWNHRAALNVLLSRLPNVALSYEVLTAVYAALTKGMQETRSTAQGMASREQLLRSMGQRSGPPNLLRTESLVLARTMYRPPAEPWVIETCFNQILGWAPVIADPIEQAFFVFVHLLYLQPFAVLNASMACLAVNIPLLRAGLPPITFAAICGADLLDGLRGVWELNRTELLRDVFVAAYDDCRTRYAR